MTGIRVMWNMWTPLVQQKDQIPLPVSGRTWMGTEIPRLVAGARKISCRQKNILLLLPSQWTRRQPV